MGWKILARHKKWVVGATIMESVESPDRTEGKSFRRFTATIAGWGSYVPFEGYAEAGVAEMVIAKVKAMVDQVKGTQDTMIHSTLNTLGVGSIQQAHKYAKRKAVYGHRPWIVWKDAIGTPKFARATKESLRIAIEEVNGKRFTGFGTDGTGHVMTPATAQVWLRNARINALV